MTGIRNNPRYEGPGSPSSTGTLRYTQHDSLVVYPAGFLRCIPSTVLTVVYPALFSPLYTQHTHRCIPSIPTVVYPTGENTQGIPNRREHPEVYPPGEIPTVIPPERLNPEVSHPERLTPEVSHPERLSHPGLYLPERLSHPGLYPPERLGRRLYPPGRLGVYYTHQGG